MIELAAARLRALPRRLTTGATFVLAIFALFLVIRWPFRAEYLVNWDAVQLALGAEDFDVEAHQPHPPGYIGYIALARLLSMTGSDVPGALTLISLISAALAPAVFLLLARRLLDNRFAIAVTLLFGFSPLLWYYGSVGLTYAPEVALVLIFAWMAHRASTEGRLRDLLIATLLLALLGAVRQSAMVLTAGIWCYALLAFPWRTRFLAAGALGTAVALWAIPLLWFAGGPQAYLRESAALAEVAGGSTSIFTGSIGGMAQNLSIVLSGLVMGLHITPAIIAFAHVRYGNVWSLLRASDRWLLGTWAVPPLAVFLLGHAGQPGYVLIVLPVAFIWLGAAIALIDRHRDAQSELMPRRPALTSLTGGVAALIIVSIVGYFMLPHAVYTFANSELAAAAQHSPPPPTPAPASAPIPRAPNELSELPGQLPLAKALRQYSIADNDHYWRDVIEYVERYDPREVIVLAGIGGPRISGGFRHLGYYLREYSVHGIGWDLDGHFGHLFKSRDGESTYSMEKLGRSHRVLHLRDARWLVIPDGDLASRLDASLPRSQVKIPSGAVITVVSVGQYSRLVFDGHDGEDARISARRLLDPLDDPLDVLPGGEACVTEEPDGCSGQAGAGARAGIAHPEESDAWR